MRSFLAAILTAVLSLVATSAWADMIRVSSPHDVGTTLDRLAAIAETKGATVFARIDHQANAAGIGLEMGPSQVLIFGNPKGGTPLMRHSASIGLDLPLRVHAFVEDGATVMMYHDPVSVAEAHGVPTDHPAVEGAAKALKGLTAAAAKP